MTKPCPICKGSLQIQVVDQHGAKWETYCLFCKGTGQRDDEELARYDMTDAEYDPDSEWVMGTES